MDLNPTESVSNFATYSLATPSDISTEIKEEADQVEPEINIKEDCENNINDIKVNDIIIDSDKKKSIISEEEQNRISDEKVAEAIRNHNEEYYDKNDESPLESDEDFKVCVHYDPLIDYLISKFNQTPFKPFQKKQNFKDVTTFFNNNPILKSYMYIRTY